jgi:YqaJ-like viral recombinase domain
VTAHITVHAEVDQGSPEWLAMRCGMLTASEAKHIMTANGKIADNDKTRAHVWELAAQRVSGHVEPTYISDDMLRGHDEELLAREAYDQCIAGTHTVGFVVNRKLGFPVGCSPDWLVGTDGIGEAKARRQKFQVQTICENVGTETCPDEYVMQVQTALWVTERKWLDFCSYSNGLHMAVIRILPDPEWQERFEDAAVAFEAKVQIAVETYRSALASGARLIPTQRRDTQEMY